MENLVKNKVRLNNYKSHLFYLKYIIFVLKYIIILIYIKKAATKRKSLIYFLSEIHLIISGHGNQSFLNDSFEFEPSEVIVNGISRNECQKFCEFEKAENNVTLYFNENVTNCKYMFSQIFNLKEIDLSKFDCSSSTSMLDMFRNCTNLEKINF